MSTEALQQIAQTNTWGALVPEISLAILALGLLVLEMALPQFAHRLIPKIAIFGQIAILGVLLFGDVATMSGEAFGGMIQFSSTGHAFRIFFLLASIFISYLAMVSLEKREMPRIEYFHILLVITGASMILALSNHFVMLFVALETVTVGFYVLVSYFRNSAVSLEAGLKYLIMGALSSAILLFGIVLLYGAGSTPGLAASNVDSLNFNNLHAFLELYPENTLALVGMLLVIAGVAFKIGAFPFQIWIPDVYQGAPTPTTALLAVGSKAAGFAMLINLVRVFDPLGDWLYPLLSVIAALTLLFGNFAALTQRNLKRMIGLSGVSHAGFLLLGIIAAREVEWANNAVIFYLFAYLFASMAVFSVLVHLGKEKDDDLTLDDLSDLSKQNGFLALALAVGIGSLAGIPPLAGFIGKTLVFVAAFKAGLYIPLAIAVLCVVVSIYYYFGVIKNAFFEQWKFQDDEEEEVAKAVPGESLCLPGRLAILATIAGSIVLGVFQGPLGAWLSGQ